jgi:hypothetical protein
MKLEAEKKSKPRTKTKKTAVRGNNYIKFASKSYFFLKCHPLQCNPFVHCDQNCS